MRRQPFHLDLVRLKDYFFLSDAYLIIHPLRRPRSGGKGDIASLDTSDTLKFFTLTLAIFYFWGLLFWEGHQRLVKPSESRPYFLARPENN